jgi:RND superfamily putative drug exporter
MFATLGRLVRRAWFLFLAAWVALLAGTQLAAPPWQQVAQDKEFAFLPKDAPSRVGEEMFAKAFPQDHLASNIVLVLHRGDAGPATVDRDVDFIENDLYPGLVNIAKEEGGLADQPPPADEPLFGDEGDQPPKPAPPPKRSIIARIRTPAAPGTGALLVSQDRQVLLVVVELTTEFLSADNWPTIDKIEHLVGDLRGQGKLPPGMEVTVTGSAVIGRDHTVAQLQSAQATELLTVILVVLLLVLIYRAPLLALIPLATVYLSVKVAVNVLAILGGAGYLTLFQGIQIYITILAYGAGVDYCLFLTARYKEELDAGRTPADAVARAVGDVGPALVASALTVICGIAMMAFAQFGKFREAGLAIPLALLLVLAATMTFSPSLLRLAGRWAFWPQRRRVVWQNAGLEAATGWRAFFRGGVLRWGWEHVGEWLFRRPGTAWLVTTAAMAPFVVIAALFYGHLSYNLIGDLPSSASSVAGTRVLQQHFPAGIMGPVNVLLVDQQVDFGGPMGNSVVKQVTDQLRAHKDELGLADVRSLTAPLGVTPAAQDGVSGFHASAEARREVMERAAEEHYVTDLGGRVKVGTRLDLVLQQSPFSDPSVKDLRRVHEAIWGALPEAVRQNSQLYFAGTTASVRDLQGVVRQDRMRIELLVLASVLVILVVLLRRFVESLYLLLSVLFSYYATLGVTFAVFWLLDPHGFAGIDWKVAIFLFTILIAVGEDYNIFLMSRVREEEREHGPARGVPVALARTGPIISSCGLIMAGTFGSLLGGSLYDMKQLGFALAFGILLDTFVVRPVLVPSFLILLHTGRLRPSAWSRGGAPAAAGGGRQTESVTR